MWAKTSHCSWDKGDMRIVQQYCPKQGGVIFKLFDGFKVNYFKSLAEAQAFAQLKEAM
jgi:hypothetical protein